MAVMYDNHHGDGSCNGKPNQTETCLVSCADTVDHVGYSCHRQNDDSQEFNDIKIRLTNLIAASGHLAAAFI